MRKEDAEGSVEQDEEYLYKVADKMKYEDIRTALLYIGLKLDNLNDRLKLVEDELESETVLEVKEEEKV